MRHLPIALLPHFNAPLWVTLLILAAHLAAGLVLGLLYFGSVWWNARQFAAGGRLLRTIGLMLGRFALLGSVLTLASLEGALPLLLTALGVLLARPVVAHAASRSA